MPTKKRKEYSYRSTYRKQLGWISRKIKELRSNKEGAYDRFAFDHNISRSTQHRIESLDKNDSDMSMSLFLHQLAALKISPVDFFNDFDCEFSQEEIQIQLKKYLDSDVEIRD